MEGLNEKVEQDQALMFQYAPKIECLCSELSNSAYCYPPTSRLDRLNLNFISSP